MYRIFLGAPSASTIDSHASYRWQTITSSASPPTRQPSFADNESRRSFILPPATMEAASRRISLMYQNAIFDRSEEFGDQSFDELSLGEGRGGVGADGSTVISWPQTDPQQRSTNSTSISAPSFLLRDDSETNSQDLHDANNVTSAFLNSTRYGTQGETSSANYSDASSIGRFPTFHFSINQLAPLGQVPTKQGIKGSVKVNMLLAVLEVEGPDTLRIKKGPDAGKEVGILKMILGDETGNVCKLTAWREVAEEWGGVRDEPGAKRGDIVHLESVLLACEPGLSATLTGSPNLKSKMTICFRTLPHSHEDGRLRPDLRLGESDPCVRKVAAVVRWFESMVGLPIRAK